MPVPQYWCVETGGSQIKPILGKLWDCVSKTAKDVPNAKALSSIPSSTNIVKIVPNKVHLSPALNKVLQFSSSEQKDHD